MKSIKEMSKAELNEYLEVVEENKYYAGINRNELDEMYWDEVIEEIQECLK